jgi:hypothetical protein
MTGRYEEKARALTLRQQQWIDQAPGYVMVDLDGTLSADGGILEGRVMQEGCAAFVLRRAQK